jgi:PTS system mannose-specific IIB component
VRVDNRLIHAKVIEGWLPIIRANHIIIANNTIAIDNMHQALLKLATPPNVKLSFLTLKDTVEAINSNKFPNDRILVLVKDLQDMLKIVEMGCVLESINVGGLYYTPGKVEITKGIYLDESDVEVLKKISSRGIKIEVRSLPMDTKLDIMDVIVKNWDKLKGRP